MPTSRAPLAQIAALVGLLAATALVAALGSLATTANVDGWYADADKPWFTPPNWLFGPVWTVLYVVIAVAAWLAWRAGASLVWWWVQLVLNLAWTPTFFALEWLWGGVVVIVALILAILLTMRSFGPRSRLAAWLLVPYLLWVCYATALNVGVAALR